MDAKAIVDMQLALINSVLGNVVLPLEDLGFEVDVFPVAHDPAPQNSESALGSVDPSSAVASSPRSNY